jgi:hypothetical protein
MRCNIVKISVTTQAVRHPHFEAKKNIIYFSSCILEKYPNSLDFTAEKDKVPA